MPEYWLPCPPNRNATLRIGAPPSEEPPAASRSRRTSSWLVTSPPRRCGNWVRVVWAAPRPAGGWRQGGGGGRGGGAGCRAVGGGGGGEEGAVPRGLPAQPGGVFAGQHEPRGTRLGFRCRGRFGGFLEDDGGDRA